MKCGLAVLVLAVSGASLIGCSLPTAALGSPDAASSMDAANDARGASDAGTDARVDGNLSDGGQDAGLDGGDDAGLDGGLDAGLDGGSDAGSDGGSDGGVDAPDPNGHACTTSGTCATGHCVDGVCCESTCSGLCQHCNGATPGLCVPVSLGADPDSECATQAASTCGTSGACDGASACALYDVTTMCVAASCSAGAATAATNCNGTGTCSPATSTSCAPYACGATVCLTHCGTNADCVGGTHCNAAGACVPASVQGTACTTGTDCASSFCVDGFCCNTTCSGVCLACSAARRGGGSDGTCGPIASGLDPDDECVVQPASTCGRTGVCDGVGACALYVNGTVCGSASCAQNIATSAPTCSGGACGVGAMTSCSPYTCNITACRTSCTMDVECISGDYCASGTCMPQLPPGAMCTANTQCSGNQCVDGVCCNAVCSGTCMACTASRTGLSDGVCGPIASGTDPDAECPMDAITTCGRTGSCSGSGTCALYTNGTICGAASCSGGTLTPAPMCGAGACLPGTMSSCSPYLCASGTSCATSCATGANCVAGDYCGAGACLPQLGQGATCTLSTQCTSGNCVDGVCCNTGCGGTCQACNMARTGHPDGACNDITNGTDPDNECVGIFSCRNGACG